MPLPSADAGSSERAVRDAETGSKGGTDPLATSDRPVRAVLFVCTANICRSPMAEAVARRRAAELGLSLVVDSAGTSDVQVGCPPDPRACLVLRRRGYLPPERQARRVRSEDFVRFDLVLGATRGHVRELCRLAPPSATARILPLLAFAPQTASLDIPDPWSGDVADYDRALDLIERGIEGLLSRLGKPAGEQERREVRQ